MGRAPLVVIGTLAVALGIGFALAWPAGETKAPAPPTPPTATAPSDAPDIVVITLDTTRADHLGAYGYFRQTTPRIDALASEGLLFERLVVPMATTAPTHTSLFTATWPHEHGVLANVEHGGRTMPSAGLVPFASWAHDHGYTTAGFVSATPLDTSSGIQRGFDVYDVPPEGHAERTGDHTTDAALAWLAEAGPAPMLLWVHYYDAHNPWRAPKAYEDRFRGPDAQLDAWLAARDVAQVTHRPTGQRVLARPANNQYDAELAFLDDQVGRLLDGIAARGRADRTLFVVMGDHGEGLNQHEEPGHGLVWQEQLHAPLIVRAPGVAPRRVSTLLSAADVLPTALGLVDLPDEASFLATASGVDVLAAGFEERPVVSQMSARQLTFGKTMTYVLTGPRFKCRWADGEVSQLWDLTADPHELHTVDDPTTLEACVNEGKEIVTAQKARGEALGGGQRVDLSDAERARLKALGYVDQG